jgi:hypothetical protein
MKIHARIEIDKCIPGLLPIPIALIYILLYYYAIIYLYFQENNP